MKNPLPRRTLSLWRIRCAVLCFLAAFAAGLIFHEKPVPLAVCLALVGVLFLLFWCAYYPLKYRRTSWSIRQGSLICTGGVFYARRYCLPLSAVQYVSVLRTPDMLPFSLCSLIIHLAGSAVYLPGLDRKDALSLQQRLTRTPPEDLP